MFLLRWILVQMQTYSLEMPYFRTMFIGFSSYSFLKDFALVPFWNKGLHQCGNVALSVEEILLIAFSVITDHLGIEQYIDCTSRKSFYILGELLKTDNNYLFFQELYNVSIRRVQRACRHKHMCVCKLACNTIYCVRLV